MASRTTTWKVGTEWVFQCGIASDALHYLAVFWPDFVEISGSVFLPDLVTTQPYRRRASQALAAAQDRELVERDYNQLSIEHLFARADSDELLVSVAEVLQETWGAKLRRDFPGRQFGFEFYRDAEEPTLTFFEVRDGGVTEDGSKGAAASSAP